MQNSIILDRASQLTGSALSKFFAEELVAIHACETRLAETLPYVQLSAHAEPLKQSFGDYILQNQQQLFRLAQIFGILSINPGNAACGSMAALIAETNDTIDRTPPGTSTRDAAVIIAIQKIAHYKIATYGSMEQLATTLGMEEVNLLLLQSLREEKDYDLLLTDIAEKKVNWLAETEQ